MKKLLALLFALTLVVSAAAGCSTPAESDGEKIFTYADAVEPVSIDTSLTSDSMGGDVLYHLSEGLVRYSGGEIIAGVAEDWEISEDGLTYTFFLRDSVWEDGEPVTAYDFEYAFLRFLSPDTASTTVEIAYDIVNARAFNTGEITDASEVGVKALDETTFEITLERSLPYFLSLLASRASFYPLRQDFVEAAGSNYATSPEHFLSNGPFILAEWQHEASLTMTKNETYWNADAVNLDGIELLVIPDANTRLSMFDSGELDYVSSLPSGQEVNYPDHNLRSAGNVAFLQFNMAGKTAESGALTSNANFRNALSYAIDRDAYNAAAVSPFAESANRFAHPTHAGVNGNFVDEYPVQNTVPLTGDTDKAQEYLELALEELGTSIDQLPTLTFVTFEIPARRTVAEALIDTWERVLGLTNIEIQMLPIPQAIQGAAMGEYDIYYQTMGADIDPYIFLAYWRSTGGINWTRWGSPAYDELIDAVNNILDPAERFAKLQEAEQYLLDNGPFVMLTYENFAYVQQDYVTGLDTSYGGAAAKLIYTDLTK
ncbi:MAG: peptide ABC transporter substrate-binding protein [Firmicutes bacterium]|nr:peptide ABC transporter substrate-binding protein [Bacillota bacterium]